VTRRIPFVLVVLTLLCLAAPAGAHAAVGGITVLPEPDGCYTDTGESYAGGLTCTTLPVSPYSSDHYYAGMGGALAPDGSAVYLGGDGRLDVLTRDPVGGALTHSSCWDNGTTGEHADDCASPVGANKALLFDPVHVTVAGEDVYAGDGTVLYHLRRQPDGTLQMQDDCLSYQAGVDCAPGHGLSGFATAVSPDGTQLFIGSSGGELYAFDRDPATGALSQEAAPVCVTMDGRDRYSATPEVDGACLTGRGVGSQYRSIAFSPDGEQLYAATEYGFAIFDRDPASGEISQATGGDGCYAWSAVSEPTCTQHDLAYAGHDVAVAPDGETVYAVMDQGLLVFDRDPSTKTLTLLPGTDGCIQGGFGSVIGCAHVAGAEYLRDVTVSPDGLNVYTHGTGSTGDRIQAWSRASDGALAKLGGAGECVSYDGAGGACSVHDLSLSRLPVFAVTPDGASLYAAGSGYQGHYGPGALALHRDAPPPPDTVAPTVTITKPAVGQRFTQGQSVTPEYSCADETDPSPDCEVVTPIDTSTTTGGQARFFRVRARDAAGHETTTAHGYFVDPAPVNPPVSPPSPPSPGADEAARKAAEAATKALASALQKLFSKKPPAPTPVQTILGSGISQPITATQPNTTYIGQLSGVVSAGSANVVSAGSGNVVSAGSANVVSAGCCHLRPAGGQVVSAGSANLVGGAAARRPKAKQVLLGDGGKLFEQPGTGKLKLKLNKAGRKVVAAYRAKAKAERRTGRKVRPLVLMLTVVAGKADGTTPAVFTTRRFVIKG
jgi:WD40 repeat protein